MGDNITLNYDDIEAAATQLNDGQTAINDLLDDLEALIDELTEGSFKTMVSSGAYADNFRELKQQLTEASEAIPAAAESLLAIKAQFEGADEAGAS